MQNSVKVVGRIEISDKKQKKQPVLNLCTSCGISCSSRFGDIREKVFNVDEQSWEYLCVYCYLKSK